MKRGTPDHPKMSALARALGVPRPYAVGIMEMLWQWAAKYAPQGDLGRWPDVEIAAVVDWKKAKAADLVKGLVESGWIDRSEAHRLTIHDWPDHAEDSVHTHLLKNVLKFYDGSFPKVSKLSESERKRVLEKYSQVYDSNKMECADLRGPAPALATASATAIALASAAAAAGIAESETPPAAAVKANGKRSEDELDSGTLREWMHEYMGGQFAEPDAKIVARCLKACRGHPKEEVQRLLISCHTQGKHPRGYGFFLTVFDDYFKEKIN